MDGWLQNQLLHAGVFWHITQFLFNYDYTLVESGVEISDETNQQVTLNSSSPSHSLSSSFSCLLSLSLPSHPFPPLPSPLLSSLYPPPLLFISSSSRLLSYLYPPPLLFISSSSSLLYILLLPSFLLLFAYFNSSKV